MSRELKFRVWDNLKKEWISNKHIWRMRTDEHGVGEILPNTFYWKQHPDGLTYQQYTGAKDKNGKEIYDGDILNIFWNDSYYNDYVRWSDHEKCWNPNSPLTWMISSTEVIGNLFENPELLKQ
jgi:uncharacterized phage protein (TIGR01671 family)